MPKILRRNPPRKALVATSALLLAASLLAAVYFEQVESQWLAFFGGILVATFSVLASKAARSDWVIKRRTRELERMSDRLTEEVARGDTAAEAMRAARARLQLINDALPVPIMYFDVDQRCRYHNSASEKWLALAPERIDGQFLSDIIEPRLYSEMNPYIAQTLAGETVEYEIFWLSRREEPEPVMVSHIPWAPAGSAVVGFYLMATSWVAPPPPEPEAETPPAPAPAPETLMPTPASKDGQDRALYLRSITEDMMGDVDDPRTRLSIAMRQDEFLLFVQKIQPIAPGSTEECYEILLRLQEEEDNLLPPGGFIPIAERYGMLSQIDLWVVDRLIRWCGEQQHNSSSWRSPLFCINLSEDSVVNPEYALAVRAELGRSSFSGSVLCFEIGELEALHRHDEVANLIATLKPAGCRFTIDAFGSSRVSFTYLRGLAVDFLKIDGNIIHHIARDPAELAKARAINRVCHSMGVKTIAESVESEKMLTLVRDIGIDYVQGFGIAAPAPIATLAVSEEKASAS
ncbi:MAG: EAL domain-containing protein [Betaproteobacteria bacterium]|nr:EAL domain-containing protein [Betaproteobacteria bacterium]